MTSAATRAPAIQGREGETVKGWEPLSDAELSTFGGQIKHRRRQRGWSYQEMADTVSTSKSNLYEIERGSVVPNVYLAARIAEALETTVDDLLRTGRPSDGSASEPTP